MKSRLLYFFFSAIFSDFFRFWQPAGFQSATAFTLEF
jgi:hypothetical protein